jgi:hypothetical protein
MPRQRTRAELDRHHRAITKLRAELFRVHSAEELRIDLRSEQISPPYVSGRIGEAATLGGLQYCAEAVKPGQWFVVSITHNRGDEFTIQNSIHDERRQAFTRFSVTRRFCELSESLQRVLQMARDEERHVLQLKPSEERNR